CAAVVIALLCYYFQPREKTPEWLADARIEFVDRENQESRKVPLNADIQLQVREIPGGATISWSGATRGEIRPASGDRVTYVGQRLGAESVTAAITYDGKMGSLQLQFEVVGPFIEKERQ